MAGLTPQQKIDLITDQLQEVLRPEILEDVIVKQSRPLVVYWGTATTGRPHCGYFVPMVKIAHFLRAGCRVKTCVQMSTVSLTMRRLQLNLSSSVQSTIVW